MDVINEFAHKKAVIWTKLICSMLLIISCSEPANREPTNTPEVLLGSIAAKVALPPMIPNDQELVEGLESGATAVIYFNRCPETEAFIMQKPLGSLVCGEKYKVFYDIPRKMWTVIGPNENLALTNGYDITAGSYQGLPPSERFMVIWGVGLKINSDKSLSLNEEIVGTLIHGEEQNRIADLKPGSASEKVAK